ncbi:MAG: sulfurtransferase-like selenium metabolism protein YedF [Desulfitobacteriaceae bacterium]|nr:sulfurtransferase-like selenium metabolism protein YedF [Desulfitobacteriaceae bacterium]
MTVKIDARGLACPAPVIRTKDAIEKSPEEEIITIVDNEAAKENVKRLGEKLKFSVQITEADGDFYLSLTKGDLCRSAVEAVSSLSDWVILVAGDKMGEGAEELGKILVKSYFYALTEAKPYSQAIIFVNSGVRLTTEGSEVLENLEKLHDEGVEILSCGTCLDYYGLKDKLRVGEVSNMYTIVEKMNEASKVIRI